MLKNEVTEKETILVNVKSELDAYNEQLRKNSQELLQVINKKYCVEKSRSKSKRCLFIDNFEQYYLEMNKYKNVYALKESSYFAN
jgi:hypothetical protein